jgi:hypothetical protein
MTTTVETITTELARLLDGEPPRSMHSTELQALLNALGRLQYPWDHSRLGGAVVELILGRCRATLTAERELAHMQGGARLS